MCRAVRAGIVTSHSHKFIFFSWDESLGQESGYNWMCCNKPFPLTIIVLKIKRNSIRLQAWWWFKRMRFQVQVCLSPTLSFTPAPPGTRPPWDRGRLWEAGTTITPFGWHSKQSTFLPLLLCALPISHTDYDIITQAQESRGRGNSFLISGIFWFSTVEQMVIPQIFVFVSWHPLWMHLLRRGR